METVRPSDRGSRFVLVWVRCSGTIPVTGSRSGRRTEMSESSACMGATSASDCSGLWTAANYAYGSRQFLPIPSPSSPASCLPLAPSLQNLQNWRTAICSHSIFSVQDAICQSFVGPESRFVSAVRSSPGLSFRSSITDFLSFENRDFCSSPEGCKG